MKQAVITGATCSLGIALIKYLMEQKVEVTAIIRPQSQRSANIPSSPNVHIVECELSALSSLAASLPHHDDGAFFHLGWNTVSRAMTNDPSAQAESIVYTMDAVKLAHAIGSTVFIGAGSQAEYGHNDGLLSPDTPTHPETSYGIAKHAAGQLSRQLCDRLGMRHCWCRILSLYGPYDKDTTGIMYCINALVKGEKPSLTKAEQLWDFIYSADCAKALYLVGEKGKHGVAYPVGSGKARPLREYFESIRDNINSALPLGIGEKEYGAGQVMYLCADIQRLTNDTGFMPEHTFEEGIKKTIEWVKTRNLK